MDGNEKHIVLEAMRYAIRYYESNAHVKDRSEGEIKPTMEHGCPICKLICAIDVLVNAQ
jgi:hypothetical protein